MIMSENFHIDTNEKLLKSIVSDRMYKSDASAFREQYVNALSHGCMAYHTEYGYTDDVYVHVLFDLGHRKVTITDNGMGMSEETFRQHFMAFGRSTVDENTNNVRSGMWGLGAISFYRIATVCIVESKDRKTGEHFAYMTRDTDRSEFVKNRTLEHYGTKTEIFLKESVRPDTLIEMVESIAKNYPVKTVMEVINAEEEQSINTYQERRDDYKEFEPVHEFEDYVDSKTESKYTKIHDDDEIEVYLSNEKRERTKLFLCRIPIHMSGGYFGFYVMANIKREKRMGIDSFGNERLMEIPKPDRDEITEESEEYFKKKIQDSIDTVLYKIDITSYDEFLKSDQRWILAGYSIDDKLNHTTREFIQKLRSVVKFRNNSGIQKRHTSILDLLVNHDMIFYHPTLNKSAHDSVSKHLDRYIITIDDQCGLPIEDIREYKKKHKIKGKTNSSIPGSKINIHSVYSYNSVKYNPDDWDEVYYIGDRYGISELYKSWSDIRDDVKQKIGFTVAKSTAKYFPTIDKKIAEINKACDDGMILHGKNKVKDWEELLSISHSIILHYGLRNSVYRGEKHDKMFLFVPKKLMSFIYSYTRLIGKFSDIGLRQNFKINHFIDLMKIKKSILNKPQFHDIILDYVNKHISTHSYTENRLFHADILEIICYGKKITFEEYNDLVEQYNGPTYYVIGYDDLYPETHDNSIARNHGFDKVITDNGEKYMIKSGSVDIGINTFSIIKHDDQYMLASNDMNGYHVLVHEGKPFIAKRYRGY